MTDVSVLYRPDKDVAKILGRSVDWLRDNIDDLESQYGFPKKDPAIGLRFVPAIVKWAEGRNLQSPQPQQNRGNSNAF